MAPALQAARGESRSLAGGKPVLGFISRKGWEDGVLALLLALSLHEC